jgi:hypothetical protein
MFLQVGGGWTYAYSSIICIYQFIHPSVHPSIIVPSPWPCKRQQQRHTGEACVRCRCCFGAFWLFRELSSVARLTPPPSFPFVPVSLSLHLLLFLSLASWHYTNFVAFFTFDSSFLSY